jgi:uncharacterized delta-60 repeat protein
MKTKFTLILLIAALFGGPWSAERAAANEVIYRTGFEPPTYIADQTIDGQDGWYRFPVGLGSSGVISTVNPSEGVQCLLLHGVFNNTRRSLLPHTGNPPPVRVELSADVRLDGPQTGTLGTPAQDILSANFSAWALLPNGNIGLLGGFFVSSAGKIWNYTGVPGESYLYEVPAPLGSYHHLTLRVDFLARTVTYVVDGTTLGSTAFSSLTSLSDRVFSGDLQLAGPSSPIETPDLSYDPANYTAYFDNYLVESLPVGPADIDVRFTQTDYAASERDSSAGVTIERRGYTNSAVTVSFQTANGTATAGQDHRAVTNTVAFAPGEFAKTITVPLLNDGLAESDETIALTVAAVTPGLPVSRGSSVLWILDDERAGSADPAFHFNPAEFDIEFLFEITSTVPLPGGKILVQLVGDDGTGNFIAVLARCNADGSRDMSFDLYPVAPIGGPPQVVAINGGRRVLVNHGDHLVRLAANGKEDSGFQVAIAGGYGFIVDQLVQPDQKIVIAGSFDTVNGVPRKNIARLLIDGAVDPTFDPGAGPDDLIWDVTRQPDGKFIIAGWFLNVGSEQRLNLARLNTDGTLDTSFDPGSGFGSPFGYVDLRAIVAQPDGKILVGGLFDSYRGEAGNALVRLLPDGSRDASFATGTGLTTSGNRQFPGVPFPATAVGLVLQPDGKIVVNGDFIYFDGQFANAVVRINANGSIDNTFKLGGLDTFAIPETGFIGSLISGLPISLLPDGDILLSLFHRRSVYRSEPVTYNGVVRLNGDPAGK